MRWHPSVLDPVLVLLATTVVFSACTEHYESHGSNVTVYQSVEITDPFDDLVVGDVIPSTPLIWTRKDIDYVRALVNTFNRRHNRKWDGVYVGNCFFYHLTRDRRRCFDLRIKALIEMRGLYIKELQVLGVR